MGQAGVPGGLDLNDIKRVSAPNLFFALVYILSGFLGNSSDIHMVIYLV